VSSLPRPNVDLKNLTSSFALKLEIKYAKVIAELNKGVT